MKITNIFLGVFSRDPHEVFDFLVKLINQAKRRCRFMLNV